MQVFREKDAILSLIGHLRVGKNKFLMFSEVNLDAEGNRQAS